MSGQATGWVLRYGPRDRAMRLVLITIADAANRDGRHSHPGIAAMVEGSLYSRAHVLAVVKRLLDDTWIVIEEEGGGRGRATTYGIPGVVDHPTGRPEKGPTTGPITEAETVQSQRIKGPVSSGNSPVDPHPTRDDAAPTVYPTVENNENPSCAPSGDAHQTTLLPSDPPAATAPPVNDPLRGFDEFWESYPKRNGKRIGRGTCQTIWRGLSLEDKRAAWRGTQHYAAACAAQLQGAMDPERFLRRRFWTDWQTPAVPDRPPRTGVPPASTNERQGIVTDRDIGGVTKITRRPDSG